MTSQPITRREAIKTAAGTAVVLLVGSACQEKKQETPANQKTAKVSRVSPLLQREVECGKYTDFWSGPPKAELQLTVIAPPGCQGSVYLRNPLTEQTKSVADPTDKGGRSEYGIPVADGAVLGVSCSGTATVPAAKCIVRITGTVPDYPPGVLPGPTQLVTPGPPVKNPATAAAIGTPVSVDCNKSGVLFAGKSAYVTVVYKGNGKCTARVVTDSGKSDSTSAEFVHTFGPITGLTGYCDGNGTDSCDFQVVEVIELP